MSITNRKVRQSISAELGPNRSPGVRAEFALLDMGFRPFFLCAGIGALGLMAAWLATLRGLWVPSGYFPPNIWHAHEMLFGYCAAVIAGFLLTAARNWSGVSTANGWRLGVLALFWLAGRLVMAGDVLPDPVAAAVDMAFLPALFIALWRPLWIAGKPANRIFLLLLVIMTTANALTHAQGLQLTTDTAGMGVRLMMDLVIALMLIIGGRVTPSFTEKAVPGRPVPRRPGLSRFILLAVAAFAVADVLWPASVFAAAVAILAGSGQALRVALWYRAGVIRVPILAVLYSGLGWLAVGLMLWGLAVLGFAPQDVARHVLTVGGIGIVTLGMMARVALGHTGRPMVSAGATNAAFGLLNLAVVLRGFGPWLAPAHYLTWIVTAGMAWAAAFGLFAWVYTPFLLRPRADGRPA